MPLVSSANLKRDSKSDEKPGTVKVGLANESELYEGRLKSL